MALGGIDALRELHAVLESDVVGEALGVLGPQSVERTRQQSGEEVVVLERQRERRIERPGPIVLRRAPGGARHAVGGGTGDLDHEVAATGELLEVVAGDVGVQLEVLGHGTRGDAGLSGIPGEEVDLPPAWGRRTRW